MFRGDPEKQRALFERFSLGIPDELLPEPEPEPEDPEGSEDRGVQED